MGNSGVGKSTAIKHILLSEYMKGTRIIVIDPESEYKELCQNLNGDWINAAIPFRSDRHQGMMKMRRKNFGCTGMKAMA